MDLARQYHLLLLLVDRQLAEPVGGQTAVLPIRQGCVALLAQQAAGSLAVLPIGSHLAALPQQEQVLEPLLVLRAALMAQQDLLAMAQIPGRPSPPFQEQ
jgi:hypothetical protein